MKKIDPRWNDIRITKGSGNVFVDLGFDEAEAQVMALRAEYQTATSLHHSEEDCMPELRISAIRAHRSPD